MELTTNSRQYITAVQQGTPYYQLTANEAREVRASLQNEIYTAPELASIQNTSFIARDGHEIAARIYTPLGTGPFPIVLYYHGGGWVFGNLDAVDGGCRFIAAEAQCIVVSVDYRLAPEYKFPTPVHDAYDALLWTYKQATLWNGLAEYISVAGDSAGGNLATVVAHLAKQQNGPTISTQLLIYPVTDVSRQSSSYTTFDRQYGLDAQAMEWFSKLYTNSEDELRSPYISPLLADNVSGLPRTLIVAAEADILLDEGKAYAEKLKLANVPTDYIVKEGLIHSYFSKMNFFAAETKETAQLIAKFLNTSL